MLAVVQTEGVRAALQKVYPDPSYDFPIVTMTTAGDNNQTTPLYLLSNPGSSSSGPAKSLWTEELELALLEGKVDVIVHCVKDMPTTLPAGCELACMLEREDPRDALVVKKGLPYKTLAEMPEGSVIGTSSVRRTAQLSRNYPKLKFMSVVRNQSWMRSALADLCFTARQSVSLLKPISRSLLIPQPNSFPQARC